MRKKCVAGNWKMHGSMDDNAKLMAGLESVAGVDIIVAPCFAHLGAVANLLKGSDIQLAAQNAHFESSGAFTGEVALPMLKELGCSYVILGHSERRQLFAEDNAFINKKVCAAQSNGLVPILCVGETQAERESEQTLEVIKSQLTEGLVAATLSGDKMIIAYEPVWAIGTGLTATPSQAEEVHAFIRQQLDDLGGSADSIRVLYGGSVKPDNAKELFNMPNIDGGLVGGASLKAEQFATICRLACS